MPVKKKDIDNHEELSDDPEIKRSHAKHLSDRLDDIDDVMMNRIEQVKPIESNWTEERNKIIKELGV